MSHWSHEELHRIAKQEELEIAPLQEDGATYRKAVPIWAVEVDDALYVRAYKGRSSEWYRSALKQKAGRIRAAGKTEEVSFAPVDGAINDRIDEAYRAKYRGSPYVGHMTRPDIRVTTVRVAPRELRQ